MISASVRVLLPWFRCSPPYHVLDVRIVFIKSIYQFPLDTGLERLYNVGRKGVRMLPYTVDLFLSYTFSSKLPPFPSIMQRRSAHVSNTYDWHLTDRPLYPVPPNFGKLKAQVYISAQFDVIYTYLRERSKIMTVPRPGDEIQHALVSLLVVPDANLKLPGINKKNLKVEYALSYFNRQRRKLISFDNPIERAAEVPTEILTSIHLATYVYPSGILGAIWC